MPLEPRPLPAGIAAQARGGEEHEPEQQGGRGAADELEPARGDGIGLLQREQGLGGPGEAERRSKPVDAVRCV